MELGELQPSALAALSSLRLLADTDAGAYAYVCLLWPCIG
jgi:hypothetical protein